MIAIFYIAFSIHFPFCVHLLFQIAIEVFCDVKVFMKFAYILQMMLAEKHRNVKFRPFLLIWYHSFGIKANKWMSKMLILSVSVLNRIIDSLLYKIRLFLRIIRFVIPLGLTVQENKRQIRTNVRFHVKAFMLM